MAYYSKNVNNKYICLIRNTSVDIVFINGHKIPFKCGPAPLNNVVKCIKILCARGLWQHTFY
jgi:hypothetical protein